jgi:hypothetical protein
LMAATGVPPPETSSAVSLTNIQLAIYRRSAGGHTMAARRWFSYRRHGSVRYDRSHFADGSR